MKTSNFARASRDPGAISIARGTPSWFDGQRFEPLMPPWALVSWAKASIRKGDRDSQACRRYVEAYHAEVLDKLDPARVAETIEHLCHLPAGPVEPVLLCWEAPGEFCHRRIVADWFKAQLGMEVSER